MTADDRKATAGRERLRALYRKIHIVPAPRRSFECPKLKSCARVSHGGLITGTWAYVGTAYGQARVSGRRVRILFVAMDRGGHPGDPVDLASTQRDFRCAAEDRLNANAHMGGVHLIMRALVEDEDPKVFARQFALTNAVKCRRATGTMRATRDKAIVGNCAEHLREEIKALRPTLIITQGAHPSSTVRNLKQFSRGPVAKYSNGATENAREAQIFYSKKCILLTTPHPARLNGLRWKKGKGELPRFLINAVNRIRRDVARGIV